MIGPDLPIVPLGSDQHTGVVEDAHAERAGLEPRIWAATRRRAASSSASVRGPCSFSHSVTARSPSRMTSARLAARVIQSETLPPSAAAAERIPSWTSGSTVIASLGEGRPRDMTHVYYQSRRLWIRIYRRDPGVCGSRSAYGSQIPLLRVDRMHLTSRFAVPAIRFGGSVPPAGVDAIAAGPQYSRRWLFRHASSLQLAVDVDASWLHPRQGRPIPVGGPGGPSLGPPGNSGSDTGPFRGPARKLVSPARASHDVGPGAL